MSERIRTQTNQDALLMRHTARPKPITAPADSPGLLTVGGLTARQQAVMQRQQTQGNAAVRRSVMIDEMDVSPPEPPEPEYSYDPTEEKDEDEDLLHGPDHIPGRSMFPEDKEPASEEDILYEDENKRQELKSGKPAMDDPTVEDDTKMA